MGFVVLSQAKEIQEANGVWGRRTEIKTTKSVWSVYE